jgi:hypothetical protein
MFSAGQYLWIKRAATRDEEVKRSVVDLHVSLGKAKVLSDSIHNAPDVRWIKVEGNFAKANIVDFNRVDAFLWCLPATMRTLEEHYFSPIRTAVALPDEARKERIITNARIAIRRYVPASEMAVHGKANNNMVNNAASVNRNSLRAESIVQNPTQYLDFTALYHMVRD